MKTQTEKIDFEVSKTAGKFPSKIQLHIPKDSVRPYTMDVPTNGYYGEDLDENPLVSCTIGISSK